MKKGFVFFDTETTGLSSEDQIIEIYAIKYNHDGQKVDEFHSRIKPTVPINYHAQQAHGISEYELRHEQHEEVIIPQFNSFIEGCVLIAHNVNFDARMLSCALARQNINSFNNELRCTLQMSKKRLPFLKTHKLSDVATHFKIPLNNNSLHSAKYDVEVMIEVYKHLTKH